MKSPLRWLSAALTLAAGTLFLCVSLNTAAAQATGTVRGTVIDATNRRPVDGAQIFAFGTDLATLTSANGQFQLNLPVGEVTLRARRVGYASLSKKATVTAGEVTTLDFELGQAAIGLDAIVVTGTGVETEKRKLGNTIATIDATQLRNAPVLNFSEQLAAREPGVSVLPSGGLTGEGAQIRIRGTATLTQVNEPIVYVDGIRVDRSGGFGDWIGTGGGGTPSRLDDINPEAIERIEVLKGAAAATLYGTEASAGVVQIFTRTGARGAPRFDFTSEQGFSTYPLSRYAPNAGFARSDTQATRLSQFYGTTIKPFEVFERPFLKDFVETGYGSTYSGSVSGGTPGVTYYVNTRLQREDGPFGAEKLGPARDFDRKVQGSASVVILPTDNVRIRVNSEYTDAHHETPNNNNNIYAPFTLAQFGHPERASCVTFRASSVPTGNGSCSLADPSGNPIPGTLGPGNPYGVFSFATPREAMQRYNKQDTKHFIGNIHITYQPLPKVSVEGTVGVDVVNQLSGAFRPFGHEVDGFTAVSPGGFKAVDDRTTRTVTAEAKATWQRQFGERFSSVLVAGGQGFITRMEDEAAEGDAFPGPGLEVTGAGATQFAYERFLETVNAGAFAQEQVGYRDYAFFTVGGRYDRNSAFGKTSEGVFYPKASLSVVPSATPGWGNSSLTSKISTLRLRGAIGRSGLQPGAYDKLTTFEPLASELGPGLAPSNLGNSNLKPEVSTEWEVGTELGLFRDRAAVDVTYYRRTTKDALYDRQFAPSGGFRNTQIVNLAQLKAGGYELSVTGFPISKPDVSVKLFANAAWQWDWVTSLGGAPPVKVGGSYPRYRNFVEAGYAPNSLFGAKLPGPCSARPAGASYLCLNPGELPYDLTGPAGVPDGKPDTEQQLLAYLSVPRSPTALNPLRVDEDGDGDYLDHYLGKSSPDWQGSFGANITLLRNLELASVFEYKFGNYTVTNLTDAFRNSSPTIGRNNRKAAEVDATLQNPASTPQQRLEAAKTWAYRLKGLSPYDGLNQNEKGDFLRWRELSVTYNVPSSWTERRLGLRYMSITAGVRNLALWTAYSGADPEENEYGRGGANADLGGVNQNIGTGIDAFGFALPRRFTFAVRLGF